MSDALHTPGPWFSHARLTASENSRGFQIVATDSFAVAHVYPLGADDTPEAKANAALIAAAPDLLAAAQRALAIECSVTQGQEKELRMGYADSLCAVITKATGESA